MKSVRVVWNGAREDSKDLSGSINGKITIWPNRKEMSFRGPMRKSIYLLWKEAHRADEILTKYSLCLLPHDILLLRTCWGNFYLSSAIFCNGWRRSQ